MSTLYYFIHIVNRKNIYSWYVEKLSHKLLYKINNYHKMK